MGGTRRDADELECSVVSIVLPEQSTVARPVGYSLSVRELALLVDCAYRERRPTCCRVVGKCGARKLLDRSHAAHRARAVVMSRCPVCCMWIVCIG